MSDENYVREALGCLGLVLIAMLFLVGLVGVYLYNLKMM